MSETHHDCCSCVEAERQEIADLRARLATNATTIDRLSDANRVLARECDGLRTRLEEVEGGYLEWKKTALIEGGRADQAEARARQLESDKFQLVNCLGFWLEYARGKGAITKAGDDLLAALAASPARKP